ncbi:MAG: hypothetical protein JW834_02660 [Candidatus Diapherotrites archaeon]|nr:hypothetical protein [Candidatus Diapherotrites archaeon]
MTKYETTIKMRARERIPDLRTILEGLYFRKPELAKKAEAFIYTIIEKKRIPDKDWAETQRSLSCTHQEYYTMLNKLRDAGMITKREGEWMLSEQFGNRCREMTDIWNSFIKRWQTERKQ